MKIATKLKLERIVNDKNHPNQFSLQSQILATAIT